MSKTSSYTWQKCDVCGFDFLEHLALTARIQEQPDAIHVCPCCTNEGASNNLAPVANKNTNQIEQKGEPA